MFRPYSENSSLCNQPDVYRNEAFNNLNSDLNQFQMKVVILEMQKEWRPPRSLTTGLYYDVLAVTISCQTQQRHQLVHYDLHHWLQETSLHWCEAVYTQVHWQL